MQLRNLIKLLVLFIRKMFFFCKPSNLLRLNIYMHFFFHFLTLLTIK
jgi:hypothetical protein